MVTQTRVCDEGKHKRTEHVLRLRHTSQINGAEADEAVLLNSHDGTSSYQMLTGMFRFTCSNGLACGDTVVDMCVPHEGDVSEYVTGGVYKVLRGFDRVKDSRGAIHTITLHDSEVEVFARSALTLKYDPTNNKPTLIAESQILVPRQFGDRHPNSWSVFNHTQEGLTKGGSHGCSTSGRRQQTRPMQGISSGMCLNRAFWMLADGLRQLKV